MSRYKFMGWSCIIFSPIMFFFSVWELNERIKMSIFLLLFGLLALSIKEDVLE